MSAVVEFPVKPEARPYLAAFAENAGEPQWLRDLRRRGLNRFAELGFPNRKSEAWRYFDLQPLERAPLLPATPSGPPAAPGVGFAAAPARIVLRDGETLMPLAAGDLPAGVWLGSIRRRIAHQPDLIAGLTLGETGAEDRFAALDAALFTDGYVLDIAAGHACDAPIDVVHDISAGGAVHTRSLINLAAGSRATLVETYAGPETGAGRYWRNDVVVARLGVGAELTRIVVVEEGGEAIHTALFDAALDQGARLAGFVLLLAGGRVRQEWNVRLAGAGARCRLDGAYIVAGADAANIVTSVDHAAPGGETRELIKGVAAGRGHGAFQGRIVVREHAQKSDAHQLSRNLMLGRRAVIDTKPELEILADDVKCSHGASVGELDEAALFYLRSRGIPLEAARRLLLEGFLREAAEGVADAEIRDHLLRRLGERLGRLEDNA